MRDVRAGVFCYLIVTVLFLAPFTSADGGKVQQCLLNLAEEQCGTYGRCVQKSPEEKGFCECLREYVQRDGQCLQNKTLLAANETSAQPESAAVVGVLLYLGARRYKWLQRFRLLRPNRHGDILVTRDDDDDDDPPIGTRCAPV
ncbi:uncharacterized protein LOC117226389 isoform X2 [Megalopta genalis]|uniref:uncharacterized protein LOC117226389 isoform X2 n=1 Tax=Megalopta genalis TaxID=115081 RepID=UPI003FD39368